jgi:hypothetical protein
VNARGLSGRLVQAFRRAINRAAIGSNASLAAPAIVADIVKRLDAEPFKLIDVGCSGGIDRRWRLLEPNLHATGFDANVQECTRLREAERNKHVEYIASFVDIEPTHPFAKQAAGKSFWGRNPWNRLAVARATELKASRTARASNEALTRENLWRQAQLADPEKPIVLSEFITARGITNIDFIKIDVDGADFNILNSLDGLLSKLNVMGLLLEVNWFGTSESTDHTFHNTDRFMKQHGFDLFDVTVRRYSMAALPGRFVWPFPSDSMGPAGRPLQGDALYLRDLVSPEFIDLARRMTTEKLWKSALLFDLFDMPDCAAELLIAYADRFGGRVVVRPMLDTLARRQSSSLGRMWDYREHMRRFDEQDRAFYPPKR